MLRETIILLDDKCIPFIIVSLPDLSQHPAEKNVPDTVQQCLQGNSDDTGTPFLNMLPVLHEAGDIATVYLMYYNPDNTGDPNAPGAGAMMYSGDGHLSVYGNLVTARALADLLVENNL